MFSARSPQPVALYGAHSSFVEKPEPLLGFRRHVADMKQAPHECRPWLLGHRLDRGKAPELTLVHLDLSDGILQHPVLKHREAGLLPPRKHAFRYRFSHNEPPADARNEISEGSLVAGLSCGRQ